MAGSYVIDASNVTLALGSGAGRVEILRGVALQVASGESVALLGPSGSGKSSLMAVLSGLERATGGTIRIAGADFSALGEDDLARARQGQIGIKELPAEVQLPVALQQAERKSHQNGGAQNLDDLERNAILAALAQCHGNKKKAAQVLGIQRPTLYNKMKRYAIEL